MSAGRSAATDEWPDKMRIVGSRVRSSRLPGALVAAFVAGGTLLRVSYAATRGPVSSPDTAGYREAAVAWLTGGDRAADLPPLYPWLVALAPSEGWLLAANVVASSATPAVLAVAVWRVYGPWASVAAATFTALDPAFILWLPYLLTDTIALFAASALIERLSALSVSASPARAAQVGVIAGLGALARAAFAAPAVAVFAVLAFRKGRRAAVIAAAAALLTLAVPAACNVNRSGEAVPYRSQTWLLLWAGTTWTEVGRGTGGVDINYPSGHERWDRAMRETYYREETLRALAERPADLVERTVKKVVWLWLPAYPEWSVAHKTVSTLFLIPLYVMAAVGAVSLRRVPLTAMLIAMVIAITASAALTIVDYDARYRLPGELVLCALAGGGTASAVARFRRRRLA